MLLIAIKAMLHVTINSSTSSQNIAPSNWSAAMVVGHSGNIGLYVHAIANSFGMLQIDTTGSRAKEMTGIRCDGFPLAASGKITQILLETVSSGEVG